MGKVSARTLRMRALAKVSAESRARRRNNQNDSSCSSSVINSDGNSPASTRIDAPTTSKVQQIQAMIGWNEKAEKAASRYSYAGSYSDRHERRLRQKNREMAKGNLSILNFFNPLPATTVVVSSSRQAENTADKEGDTQLSNSQCLKDAQKYLSQSAVPAINTRPEQQ